MRGERLAGSLGVVVFVTVFFLQGRTLESAAFIRGDADASGQLEITDGIRVLGYLFLGSPASLDCEDASDADGSGGIDISDAVYLLNYLFIGGAAPPAPFPGCGSDPTGDSLGCEAYAACEDTQGPSKITTGPSVDVATVVVSKSGGTIAIARRGDPLDGMTLEVPTGAYTDDRTFRISYAPITNHDFGPDFNPLTPLIAISNGGGYSEKPMKLKIPARVPAEHFAMAFLYDEKSGELEGMPLLESTSDHVTVLTLNFEHSAISDTPLAAGGANDEGSSRIVMSSLPEGALIGEFDSGFFPGVDDWQFPNEGSYVEPDGICSGMSITAVWYYAEQKKKNGAPPLFGRFDNDGVRKTPNLWQDDVKGVKFASMVHLGYGKNPLDFFIVEFVQSVGQFLISDNVTLKAFAYAIKLTRKPQFAAIYSPKTENSDGSGHVLVVYYVSGNTIHVADPNYPAIRDRDRRIRYDPETGEFKPYSSGINASSLGTLYTSVYYVGRWSLVNKHRPAKHWAELQNGTIGNGSFPEYSLDALNQDGQLAPLVDGFKVPPDGLLRIDVRPFRFDAYDAEGKKLVTDLPVQLAGGTQLIGINVMDGNYDWVGFNWVSLEAPQPAGPVFVPTVTWLRSSAGPQRYEEIGTGNTMEHTVTSEVPYRPEAPATGPTVLSVSTRFKATVNAPVVVQGQPFEVSLSVLHTGDEFDPKTDSEGRAIPKPLFSHRVLASTRSVLAFANYDAKPVSPISVRLSFKPDEASGLLGAYLMTMEGTPDIRRVFNPPGGAVPPDLPFRLADPRGSPIDTLYIEDGKILLFPSSLAKTNASDFAFGMDGWENFAALIVYRQP